MVGGKKKTSTKAPSPWDRVNISKDHVHYRAHAVKLIEETRLLKQITDEMPADRVRLPPLDLFTQVLDSAMQLAEAIKNEPTTIDIKKELIEIRSILQRNENTQRRTETLTYSQVAARSPPTRLATARAPGTNSS